MDWRDIPARNRTLIRVLTLIRLLTQSEKLTLAQLATRLGCTTRTIRRDVKAIESAGGHVVTVAFTDAFWNGADTSKCPTARVYVGIEWTRVSKEQPYVARV